MERIVANVTGTLNHEIALVLATDSSYVLPTLTTIQSALLSGSHYSRIVVLGYRLKAEDEHLISGFIPQVEVMDLTDHVEELAIPEGLRLPLSAWLRIPGIGLVAEMASSILYLDSDILVRKSTDSIINSNLSKFGVAAAQDYWTPFLDRAVHLHDKIDPETRIPSEMYLNSGVLLIDSQIWKTRLLEQRMRSALETLSAENLLNADQDLLNVALEGKWHPIDYRVWNYPAQLVSPQSKSATIVHFFGKRKPWVKTCENIDFQREYAAVAKSINWKIKRSTFSKPMVRSFLPYRLTGNRTTG